MSEKTGKLIFITGASSGFGKLTAEILIQRGHTVIAGLRGGESRLAEVFSEELRRSGRLSGLDLHMETPASLNEAAEAIRSRHGRLDVLINNAGYGLMGPIESQTEEEIRYQFEVNFFGPVLLSRALLPLLKEARGRIINISSIVGLFSFPFYGTYAATKHALEALSESLHYELKPYGVQVALVEPGGFRTDFAGRNLKFGSDNQRIDATTKRRIENFQKAVERKSARVGGDPARVARLIAKLCERKRIPLRNVIGNEAVPLVWASRLVPDGWRVKMTDLAFRKGAFRE